MRFRLCANGERVGRYRRVLAFVVFLVALLSALYSFLFERPKRAPRLVPARVVVTLDGEPVSRAVVAFYPLERDGLPAFATTNSKGVAELSTFVRRDGARVGDYRVVIEKIVNLDAESFANYSEDEFVPESEAIFQRESTRALPLASGLRARVADVSENLLRFDLRTNAARPSERDASIEN